MIDHITAIAAESSRFRAALDAVPDDAPVPSCPGWTAADLRWHLTEVQHFWASIVEGALTSPAQVTALDRPAADAASASFDLHADRLLRALATTPAETRCWSWRSHDTDVGWVARRQAHEALIHRVDAELTARHPTSIDPDLAADGIDEILTEFLGGEFPEWATFTPTGETLTIVTSDDHTWGLRYGRFTGTSPDSGTTYDLDAVMMDEPSADADAGLEGDAADLVLWLWGRGPVDPIMTTGDASLVARLRAMAAEATT